MNKYFKSLKKYYPYIGLLIVGVLFLSIYGTKKPKPTGTPATFSTEKQKFVETIAVDSSIGKNLVDVEEATPELELKGTEALRGGLTLSRFRDSKNNTAVQIITDERGKVLSMTRTPVSEIERNVDDLLKNLGLGTPGSVMYPTRSSIGTVYVYPDSGVAIVFNEVSRGVYYVINFEIMPLTKFKQVFSEQFQDTPDETAY
ncbi:hypothetical protein A2380_02630 [candidate division WWE3 bacterium RIFOXYB1_FULL_43_24]|uniref:Uncharacterized protein n=2 Tax=Katanobacteria TaxID=422282 RepID=A0A0G0YP31_UNCKA|nr:MAG: hypothetical protein UU92_C0007G0083 [candidate division WWE3 bacterium GW2011_GWA1_42_12]KKS34602.1 MAG: hypothetical protein UU97_C0008G0004 [candidate division WWE3 bacterium GW2011_GWD1_42_14]KKS38435.1 MAG: hypothetical protein UV00_C0007G0016 [candidate division WWE3 bacterium GW2011_GWF1_42_14]KKS40479.1 MAG: hypothetical protein UV03_C0006G0011 [candidate division WWE3 bacterium GW2011_GWE1_42_16]KKS66160.1 MAG: hypothetical protein UV35_C0024G0004 [candidate division WWE3 bacte